MFNITSCASQNSTAIISSTIVEGGRAIDRRNPVITDKNRSGISSKSGTKNRTNDTKKNTAVKPHFVGEQNYNENYDNDNNRKAMQAGRKSFGKASDLIANALSCNTSKAGVDYVTPTRNATDCTESSRYLLDETSSFLDVVPDFNPVLKSAPFSTSVKFDDTPTLPKHSSPSSKSSDQVVMLRVSLHCRGCERKLKKHLSRMSGVTSFDIDFVAKKVTVVGDVTPVQVLSSISKVKTAKLWSTTMPPSSHISSRNMVPKTRITNSF